MVRIACFVLLLMIIANAQASVPLTHRQQDMTFDTSEVNAYAQSAYHKILVEQRRAGLLDNNAAALQRLQRIAAPLIAESKRLKYAARLWNWEIHLTSSPEIDAYCMAGGKILVSSHFLNTLQLSDDELAILLAHEIAHALAEHVREQLSEAQLRQPRYPYRTVSDASQDMNSDFGLYLHLSELSRRQEYEADTIGVELARRSGIPLHAALSFYTKLAQADRGDSGLAQTHPDAQARLRHIKRLVQQVSARH